MRFSNADSESRTWLYRPSVENSTRKLPGRGIGAHLVDVTPKVLRGREATRGDLLHTGDHGGQFLIRELVEECLYGSTSRGGSVIAPLPARLPLRVRHVGILLRPVLDQPSDLRLADGAKRGDVVRRVSLGVDIVDREQLDDVGDRLRMRDGVAVERSSARSERAVEVWLNAVSPSPIRQRARADAGDAVIKRSPRTRVPPGSESRPHRARSRRSRDWRCRGCAEHLASAGATRGSPQLNSFGPDFTLAADLLVRGSADAHDE